eukprot:GHVQ01000227.1.p1 GENE.GHVQ01000227.1~~GHVQ01000227.1.p1  ORF type:complete len:592 (+),score=54.67 GHVQ01000227.1:342-2117(+)
MESIVYLSVPATYVIVFLSLCGFAILAIYNHGISYKLIFHPDESYLSSRRSEGWFSLGCSMYASTIGNWVLFQPASVGAVGSWVPVVVYALSTSVAMSVVMIAGPMLRRRMPMGEGFTSSDFMQRRFGRSVEYVSILMSSLSMSVFLVAELTCVASAMTLLTDGHYPTLAAVIPVSVITLGYTIYAGLPASIRTDRYQGILQVLFAIIIVPVAMTNVSVTPQGWAATTKWDDNSSLYASLSLFLGISMSDVFNQGAWQRVYAAKSSTVLRKAYILAISAVFPTILLFGIAGVVSRAAYFDELTTDPDSFSNVAFFWLLKGLSASWLGAVAVMSMCMVTSSVDTLQSGLASLIGSTLTSRSLSMNWARLFTVIINLPAIILAIKGLDVLQLFMVCNTLTLATGIPTLLGFWHRTTTSGVLCGYSAGVLGSVVYGWLITGDFVEALRFSYQQPIYTIEYVGLLLNALISSGVVCVVVSLVHGRLNPMIVNQELERRQNVFDAKLHYVGKGRAMNSIIGITNALAGDTVEMEHSTLRNETNSLTNGLTLCASMDVSLSGTGDASNSGTEDLYHVDPDSSNKHPVSDASFQARRV